MASNNPIRKSEGLNSPLSEDMISERQSAFGWYGLDWDRGFGPDLGEFAVPSESDVFT